MTEAVNDVLSGQVIPPPNDLVAIEVIPAGVDEKRCEGAIVRLVRHEGQPEEVALASGLSPDQCREIARRLLIVADAASKGADRTLLCVTKTEMWAHPGQALIVHCDPDVRFNFVVQPQQIARPDKPRSVKFGRKLIRGAPF
jgi:hypothetical protein